MGLHPDGEDRLHLAQSACAHELAHLPDGGDRAVLRAGLEDARVAADGVHHVAPFTNGERHRLFAIDVLACLRGVDCLQRVPVVRRGDDHRVNVWPGQQLAVVVDARAMAIGSRAALRRADVVRLTHALLAADAVHVAHGDQLCLLVAREDVQMPAAHGAAANQADIDALVRRDRSVAAAHGCRNNPRHRQQRSGGAAPQKSTAG